MNVIREIAIYQKDGDKQIDSFKINLSIDDLIYLLDIDRMDDPNAYKQYEITYKQYLELIRLVPKLSKFNFNEGTIFYECYQI